MRIKAPIKLLVASIASIGVFSASAFAINNIHNQSVEQVSATSHPANYSLYTYSGTYYDGISSSATEGMSGSLRTALTTLIHPTSVPTYSSSGSTHLSTVLQYADEDPDNSSNMIYLYTRDSVKKNAASSWNREHVWPQSLSNGCWGTGRAGTDLLHLRPTYNTTNSTRGNLKYGNVSGASAEVYNGIAYGYRTSTYFMPLDSVKGDVARIIMYVWVAYYNEYGTSLPAITNVFQSFDVLMSWHCSDKPDVMEGNRNNYSQNSSMQGNRNPFVDHPEYAWKIFGSQCSSSVLATAKSTYPVGGSSSSTDPSIYLDRSSASIEVGSTLKLTATTENGSGSVTWTSSNTSVATVSNGTVTAVAAGSTTITATYSGVSATCAITVTTSGSGTSGETTDFTMDFTDSGNCHSISGSFTAFNYSCEKGSSTNTPVVSNELRLYFSSTGNGGFITITLASGYKLKGVVLTASSTSYIPAVKYNVDSGSDQSGSWSSTTMTITGFTASTSFKFRNANTANTQLRIKTIKLTLESISSKTLSSISLSDKTTSYTVGDTFIKPTVTATYSNGSTANVTNNTTFTGYNMSTAGNYTVTASYTYSGTTKTTTYSITVSNPVSLTGITISGTATKTQYEVGDSFDPTGLTVTAHYSDSSYATVTSDVVWTPSPLSVGDTSVTATYKGETATYSGITVSALTLTSISISGQTTTYLVGDEFSFDGSIQATYSNGSKQYVEPTYVDQSGVNMSKAGTYTVRVSYSENGTTKNATYTISVTEVPFVNSVEACYSLSEGDDTGDVYGLFVGGFNNDQSSMIMNGEFGIMLYKQSPESNWVDNSTYIHISGATLDIFNGLYQLDMTQSGITVSTFSDSATIRQNVAPITVYDVDGTESADDLTIANRLCSLTGVVTSITHKENSNTVSGFKTGSDNTVMVSVGNHETQLFVKSKSATSAVKTSLENSLNNGTTITTKGFTGFYSSTFQIQFKNLVEANSSYTAEQFAQDILTLTNTICSSSDNKESDLSGVWLTLELDKWPTLPVDQQNIIIATEANASGTTLQQGLARYDQICKKYASCDNFIGRASANHSNYLSTPVLTNNTNVTMIVVVISVISLSLVATYLIAKHKRKED